MALSNVVGLSALSDFAKGTKKQKEMSRAVTPLNSFQGNKSPEETQPKILSEKDTETKLEDKFAQRKQEPQGAAHPMMQDVVGKLGSLGLQLQSAVGNFLRNTTGALNVNLAKGGNVKYNAETGTWESDEAAVSADTSALVGEKQEQQKQLQELLKEYTDPTSKNIKSFEEALKVYADKNKDGVIDAEEQAWLSQVTNIANAIKRLRTANRNSAEYQALLAQLAYMDKNGLVSSVLDAMDEYERTFGAKIAGADTEVYTLRDLLTMGTDKIQEEIDKALYQGRGLFGGDYAQMLKKTFDASGKQYTESAKQDALISQQILERGKRYLGEVEQQLRSERERIAKVFTDTAEEVIKDYEEKLKRVPQSERAALERAMRWFRDTQTYLQRGGKIEDILFKALSTEAVPLQVKDFMRQWLGSAVGDDTAKKGTLAYLLDEMGRTGKISYYDERSGRITSVTLTPEEKYEVLQILDANMTPADKEEAVRKYIRSKSGRMYESLQRGGEELQKVAPRELVETFSNQFMDTLESFNRSFVDEAYQLAAAGYKGDTLKQAMINRINDKYKQIEQSYINAKQALEKNKIAVAESISNLRNNYNSASELKTVLRQSINNNIQNGISMYADSAKRDIDNLIHNFATQNNLPDNEKARLQNAAGILSTRLGQARFFAQLQNVNSDYAAALRSVATPGELAAVEYYSRNPYNLFIGNQQHEKAMATLAAKIPQITEAIARASKQEQAIEDALDRNLKEAENYWRQQREIDAALSTIDSQISRASAEYSRALNAVRTQTAEWLVRNAIAQQNARFTESGGLQAHGGVASIGVTRGFAPEYEQYMGAEWSPVAAISRIQSAPTPTATTPAPEPKQERQDRTDRKTIEERVDRDIIKEREGTPVANVGTGYIMRDKKTGETYYEPFGRSESDIWRKAKETGRRIAEQDMYATAERDTSGVAAKAGYSSIDRGGDETPRKVDDTAAKLRYNVFED